MDLVVLIQTVGSFIVGGGLSSLLTLRTVRRKQQREAELGDFDGLRAIIKGQGEEIVELRRQMNERADVWRTSCKQCSYRAFYFEQEKRLNERITERGEGYCRLDGRYGRPVDGV